MLLGEMDREVEETVVVNTAGDGEDLGEGDAEIELVPAAVLEAA